MPQVLRPTGSPRVAALFLHLFEAAELEARAPACFFLIEALAKGIGDLPLEMITELGIERMLQFLPICGDAATNS